MSSFPLDGVTQFSYLFTSLMDIGGLLIVFGLLGIKLLRTLATKAVVIIDCAIVENQNWTGPQRS